MKLFDKVICCPHCGHHQHITLDATMGDQDYYDDCRICCNPIHLRLHLNEAQHKIELYVDADEDQIY